VDVLVRALTERDLHDVLDLLGELLTAHKAVLVAEGPAAQVDVITAFAAFVVA
jgi:hypothetical protein